MTTDSNSSICICRDYGTHIEMCRYCTQRYYPDIIDEQIDDMADEALLEDEEWVNSNMGPAASLAHKYYKRGFVAGYKKGHSDSGV